MSVATIRSSVAALLDGVTGVGKVNTSIPFGNDADHFRDHFVDPATGKVNGWTVAVVEDSPGAHLGTIERVYRVTLRGILGVEDAQTSRATAEALIETIETTFAGTAANRRLPESGSSRCDFTDGFTYSLQEALARGPQGEFLVHVIVINFRAVLEEALA